MEDKDFLTVLVYYNRVVNRLKRPLTDTEMLRIIATLAMKGQRQ